MRKAMDKQCLIISYLYNHTVDIITGLFFWVLAYFADIKGSVTVMAVAFLLDLIIGIANSLIREKEKFQMRKVFIQFLRFMIILAIVMLLFAMDKEMGQNVASISNGVMWLVSGFLAYSVAENAFSLTGWKLFILLKKFINTETEKKTNINVDEDV